VVEIVSGESRTQDTVTKPAVYADAAIPAYWIVDLDNNEITALRLDDQGTHQTYAQGSVLILDWPLTVQLDVASLSQPPN
jgi:Uma2 family endonuclease